MTLRDYWRVVRSQKVFIVALTLVFAIAALGLALTQKKTYKASASLAYRDVSQDLGTIGVPIAPTQTTAELAAAGAQTATSVDVAMRVQPHITPRMSLQQLQDAVSANVDPLSNFVLVEASARSGPLAAQIANAFANQAAALKDADVRTQFARQAASLGHKIAGLGNSPATLASKQQLQDEQARFISLANIARPAVVAKTATVPSSPSSPKPGFDTILGAVVGLVLAVGIAFARRALDRRLRDSQEISSILDIPLIGELGASALGCSAQPDGERPMSPADLEAVRIIRRGLDVLGPDGPLRSVVITSPLPSEGKSTVAVALAVSAAAVGKRTLLVECDLRRPVLAERLGLKPTPGLTEYLQGSAAPQEITQIVPLAASNGNQASSLAQRAPGNLVAITAGASASDTDELLSSARCREFLAQVAEIYDMVIIDTAPVLPVADTLELIPYVDGVVLCVRVNQTSREQASAALAAILRFPRRPTGFVATAISGEDEVAGYAYSYSYAKS